MLIATEAIAALPPLTSKIWTVIFSAASAAAMYLSVAETPIAVTSLAPLGSLFDPIALAVAASQRKTSGFYPF